MYRMNDEVIINGVVEGIVISQPNFVILDNDETRPLPNKEQLVFVNITDEWKNPHDASRVKMLALDPSSVAFADKNPIRRWLKRERLKALGCNDTDAYCGHNFLNDPNEEPVLRRNFSYWIMRLGILEPDMPEITTIWEDWKKNRKS